MIHWAIAVLLIPTGAFALVHEPEIETEGRGQNGELLQVVAVPSGHVEGLADNEPSIAFDLPKDLHFELRTNGKWSAELPWEGRGTDYAYMPKFQFVDSGRLVVIDWKRGVKNQVEGTLAPGGHFVVNEFDFSKRKSKPLLKINWDKSELIADILVSPDLQSVAWGTTSGLALADLTSGKRQLLAKGERARFPCFNSDGIRVAAFFIKNADLGKIPEGQYSVGRIFDSKTGVLLGEFPRWHQEREGLNGGFADEAFKFAWQDHQHWESRNCHSLLNQKPGGPPPNHAHEQPGASEAKP